MALYVVATPIGNHHDISQRAVDVLSKSQLIIGEERREVSKLIKQLKLSNKPIELLNEHSTPNDVKELLVKCHHQDVALVSDAGTPGFCDPGAELVAACRSHEIKVIPVPGSSSLMCLLSVCGLRLREFLFRGFLPAEKEARGKALRELQSEKRAIVLMDTPYRLKKVLHELARQMPERRALLGCDFTQETETIVEAKLSQLPAKLGQRKAEFVLMIYPDLT